MADPVNQPLFVPYFAADIASDLTGVALRAARLEFLEEIAGLCLPCDDLGSVRRVHRLIGIAVENDRPYARYGAVRHDGAVFAAHRCEGRNGIPRCLIWQAGMHPYGSEDI